MIWKIAWIHLLLELSAAGAELAISQVVQDRLESDIPLLQIFHGNLVWSGEDKLVLSIPDNKSHLTVFAFRILDGKLKTLWEKQFGTSVDGIDANSDSVFLTSEKARKRFLSIIDVETGKVRNEVAFAGEPISFTQGGMNLSQLSEAEFEKQKEAMKGIELPPQIHALVWLDKVETVVAAGSNSFYSWSEKHPNKIDVTPFENDYLRIYSHDGETMMIAIQEAEKQAEGCLVLFDPSTKLPDVIHGKRAEKTQSIIDAPFLSNAFASGGKKVRIIDNGGWSPGYVSIHEGLVEVSNWSSGNHHAKADLSWDNEWLAISGTSKVVSLFNLEGNFLGASEGVSERVWRVTFSPDGGQIATWGEKGQIGVFSVMEKETKLHPE